MIFALAACMNEEDYYTKGDVDALVADLEAELSTKTSETNAAIAALKAEYEATKSVLEATAKANTDRIVQLTVDYNVKVAALEKADADNAAALAELKAKYDADLAILNKADIDNAAAIAALDKEYNDKVAELEASLKSSTDTINVLIGELKECDKATSETIAAMKTQIEMILAAMEKQYHTVTFVTGEGITPPEKQSVVDGKKATKPADPIKEGYTFLGWFIDGEQWSFIGYVVTEDIELTAVWEEIAHKDDDKDGKCDYCGDALQIKCDHYDDNKDGKCDDCGDALQIECEHTDSNGDEFCDKCGFLMDSGVITINYPWDRQTLIFQLTENDNNRELSSGCHRYLAGDDSIYTMAIDTSIDQRNARAKIDTKIDVTYLYWDNTATYGFGKCIEQIEQIVNSKTAKNAPDVYVNFMYDMVGCAVKGYFANLKGTTRGTGALAGLNYFEFNNADYDESVDNRGYMNDWMNSVTLSQHKMYVLGSDYFTDIVRAFFIIPVGIDLLERYGEDITGDRNKDGVFTIDDFYEQVWAGEWTYDLLMEYSDAVKIDDGNGATTKCWIGDEQVGFAINSGGLAASGLFYTTSVVVIEKQWNYETNDWDYYYPDDNEALGNFYTAAQELFAAPGVAYVKSTTSGDYNISTWGGSGSGNHIKAIRTRFSTGNVLFGDIMMVGALEYEEYQSMREVSGFGVVVVPLYDKDAGFKKDAPYLTQIHNMARPGAIAKNTTKFVECTAYLNYQSTNSTDILNEYYNYELMYNIDGGAQGTVRMLQYVRANVRTSFDKSMEDAMGVFGGQDAYDIKILPMMTRGSWGADDIRGDYKSVLEAKRGYLADLVSWFESAAD